MRASTAGLLAVLVVGRWVGVRQDHVRPILAARALSGPWLSEVVGPVVVPILVDIKARLTIIKAGSYGLCWKSAGSC